VTTVRAVRSQFKTTIRIHEVGSYSFLTETGDKGYNTVTDSIEGTDCHWLLTRRTDDLSDGYGGCAGDQDISFALENQGYGRPDDVFTPGRISL